MKQLLMMIRFSYVQSASAGTKGNSIGPLVVDAAGDAVVGVAGLVEEEVGLTVGSDPLFPFVVSVTITSPSSDEGGVSVAYVSFVADVPVGRISSGKDAEESMLPPVGIVTSPLVPVSEEVEEAGSRSSTLLHDLTAKTITSAIITTPRIIEDMIIGLLSSILFYLLHIYKLNVICILYRQFRKISPLCRQCRQLVQLSD